MSNPSSISFRSNAMVIPLSAIEWQCALNSKRKHTAHKSSVTQNLTILKAQNHVMCFVLFDFFLLSILAVLICCYPSCLNRVHIPTQAYTHYTYDTPHTAYMAWLNVLTATVSPASRTNDTVRRRWGNVAAAIIAFPCPASPHPFCSHRVDFAVGHNLAL